MNSEIINSLPSSEKIKKSPQIGVIGGSESNLPIDIEKRTKLLENAESVGRILASRGAILISGGTDGIMEASCKGAYEAGGTTVGTPGRSRDSSNQFVKIEICTPIDTGDYLFAGILSCDAIIVFPGGAGTIAEIALAYRNRIPMIIMEGYDEKYDQLVGKTLDDSADKIPFFGAADTEDAAQQALSFSIQKSSTSQPETYFQENFHSVSII